MKPHHILLSLMTALILLPGLHAQSPAGPGLQQARGIRVTDPAAAPIGFADRGTTLNKTELKKLIENTRWDKMGTGGAGHVLFYRRGEMNGAGPGLGYMNNYEVELPDILRITLTPTKNDRLKGEKPDILTYRIDVNAMTLTLDETKSTQGGVRGFKYAGPAPRK